MLSASLFVSQDSPLSSLCSDAVLFLADLGHAKDMGENPLGRTASLVGTIGKRAPEMDEGEYLPMPVDIWALGSESPSSVIPLISSDLSCSRHV